MSDTDVEEAIEELETLIWELEYGVRNFSRVTDEEAKIRKYGSLVDHLDKAKNKLKWLQYSLKMMDQGPNKERFSQKSEEFQERLNKYPPVIEALEPQKKSLLLEKTGDMDRSTFTMSNVAATSSMYVSGNPNETTTELTKKTRQLQDDAFVRLGKTNKTLDETIYIGTDTTSRLREQGAQLNSVTPRLDVTVTAVKDANKKTRKLLRLLACDRVSIILILIILVLLGSIIALSVLSAQKKIRLPLV